MGDNRLVLGTTAALVLASAVGCGDDDAMVPDGGAVCATSAECDDGMFCNGAESCDPSSALAGADGCVAGAPPCAAGVACDEASGVCGDGCEDGDGDGVPSAACGGTDCDDADPERFPGNAEVCDLDGRDEDCDPTTLGDRDEDGDGYAPAHCCNGDACGQDCDDARRGTNPDVPEVCDGLDNDCDGTVDEELLELRYVDADRDLHGDPDRPVMACPGRAGTSASMLDCDDDDPTVNGPQPEVIDERDNDCDGRVDEFPEEVTWYEDADGDGFGAADGATMTTDTPPVGFSLLASDCDDSDPAIVPGGTERCNGVDDDCDGEANFEIGVNDWEDDDDDGHADAACGGTDCDDRAATTFPSADELCDLRDNDCDAMVDEACGTECSRPDADGDGANSVACGGDDCDDEDPARFPGNPEVCDPEGVDEDCDGATLGHDRDGDGHVDAVCCNGASCGDDCLDRDALVHPARLERCNRQDDDCDGSVDEGVCTALDVLTASLAAAYSCAIRGDGDLYCWGENQDGSLGTGVPGDRDRSAPDRSVSGTGYVEVSAGDAVACGIRGDADILCWGRNAHGEVGDGLTDPELSPQFSSAGNEGRSIANGRAHACVISAVESSDGRVRCWGDNDEGQMGDSTLTDRPLGSFAGGERDWDEVVAGSDVSCGRRGARVFCWGTLGLRWFLPQEVPAPEGESWARGQLASAVTEVCAITTEGHVGCWDQHGTSVLFELRMDRAHRYADVAVGDGFRCMRAVDGTGYCVGDDDEGQLGDGATDSSRETLVEVAGGHVWDFVTAGANHACGIDAEDGFLYCWGRNAEGQLGLGTTGMPHHEPQRVTFSP